MTDEVSEKRVKFITIFVNILINSYGILLEFISTFKVCN